MSLSLPSLWLRARACLVRAAIPALCAATVLGPVSSASAGERATIVAPPTPLTYHLDMLFTQGPTAGNTLSGQIIGTRDNAGTIVAVLTNATGLTGTVSGTLGSGSVGDTGATLAVQGKVGTFTLHGQATSAVASGTYGGTVSQSGLAAGSYLLTPEPVAASYQFAAKIRAGHHKGTTLSGTMTIASEASGLFDGTLLLDDGTMYTVTGEAPFGNLSIQLYLPGQGLIVGVAPKTVQTILGNTYTIYTGTFVGPSSGDTGAWSATPS